MKKQKSRFRLNILAAYISTISSALIASSVSYAQESPEVEEIEVTGSRIRATDGMATPTPVTAITTNELQNFEPGATVAEQLDALPQFFGTQSAQRGGGASNPVRAGCPRRRSRTTRASYTAPRARSAGCTAWCRPGSRP